MKSLRSMEMGRYRGSASRRCNRDGGPLSRNRFSGRWNGATCLPNSKRYDDSVDVATTVSPRAVAHLLRHLNDGRALRANAVAAPYFPLGLAEGRSDDESLMRIRAAVEAAVLRVFDEGSDRSHVYARRRRTILEQCDLRSRPREVVAAELGLSRRQFYRDRS